MRVLAVSSYGVLGGAELHLATMVAHRPAGIDVSALVLEPGPIADRLRGLGLDVAVAHQAGFPTARGAVAFARAFDRLLAERRPDVVWAKGQKAALLCAGPCRRRGVPVVWHKVDFSWDARLARPLALAVDGVIGVSDTVLGALGPVKARRVVGVVGLPVALPDDLRPRPEPGRPLIGAVARFVPYKGLHHMVGAAAVLREEFPALRLVLAGGPAKEAPGYEAEVRALADRLGVELELPGFVDGPTSVLERLDVFLSATYRDERGFGLEGLPGAVIEASWAGVPVVAALAGATHEAVLDGRTGTVVAGPEPERLAAAVAPYLRDRALWERTGEAGRAFARERFAAPVVAQRVFEALGRVV